MYENIPSSRKSSTLLQGGTVVAFDHATESLDIRLDSSILITEDRIVAIFPVSEEHPLPPNTEVVDVRGKIITPGFIDTHRHGWQTGLKTACGNASLAEYLFRYTVLAGVGEHYHPEDVYIGQLAGLHEAIYAGVTSILDHAHSTWSAEKAHAGLQACIESGVRLWYCYNLNPHQPGFSLAEQMADLRAMEEGGRCKDSCVELGIAFDSFFNSSAEDVKRVLDLAKELKASVITTHFLGGPWSFSNDPQTLDRHGILDCSIPVIFSHASFLDSTGAQLLRSKNHYISITPESEAHYGHGNDCSHQVQDQAAFGVDTPFAFSPDILTQSRMWLQKVRETRYRRVLDGWEIPNKCPMSTHQAFLMATRHGGLALRRPDIGVLSRGAKADLLVFRCDRPNLLGWTDPVAAVMLHANIGDIEHVMINGQWKKRDGELVLQHDNLAEIQNRFLVSAERLQKTLAGIPSPELRGSFFGVSQYKTPEGVEFPQSRRVESPEKLVSGREDGV